ncbi:MAG TPA: thioredoxin domain-containing protein, partial [Anaeromyxobacter sp.]
PRFTNRLVLERSPYLLQHAHNPVDWWPWTEEAFAEARRAGKPVFLSVGYATCHWCHVMERESFEDEQIARVLNERFVPIKVDREERPDVDAIYMTAVQLLTGGGGWPMSVWLTPEKEPFFAGTYFPPRDGARGMQRGFLGILEEIAQLYADDPGRVRGATGSLVNAVRTALGAHGEPAEAAPGPKPILDAVEVLRRAFDEVNGGLRRAPKFPSNVPVRLLLRAHRRSRDPEPLRIATVTLEKMAAGGIHDQLGGGFHRYSTDAEWIVPHFEKMLYDNALLALAYAEAWQVTQRRDFARVVRQTLDYLLREMTAPEGGLYSATDADSEGEEGRFFVWDEREIRDLLGADAERFIRFHGVTAGGNFEGRNILRVPRPDEDEWEALAPARAKLRAAREERVHPLRDEKVLAGWNGLAISALAFAGRVLDEPRWIAAAARAAEFVLGRMVKEGRLQRSWLGGEAGVPAFLEDHAFLGQGLLDLYEATFDPRWLEAAVEISLKLEALFGDPEGGGWFTTAGDHERLLAREKPTHDGAEPSGASVALLDALRLSAFTTDDRWRAVADRALRHYARSLE